MPKTTFGILSCSFLVLALAGCAADKPGQTTLPLEKLIDKERANDDGNKLRGRFKCSDEEPFWSMEYSSTERLRLEPGDPDIIETTTPGGWIAINDDAGVYVWRNAETGAETTIRRQTCINVASEELAYSMAHSGNRVACCRRFTE